MPPRPSEAILAQNVPAVTVTVKGSELALLYRNRAMIHLREAERHEAELAKASVDVPDLPPLSSHVLTTLVAHERAMHDYLAFMAEHIDRDRSFVLGDAEVMALKGPVYTGLRTAVAGSRS